MDMMAGDGAANSSKGPTMWTDHIRNGVAAREAFGDDMPDLSNLELVQIVLGPAGDLALCLKLNSFPVSVPERWKQKGYDQLQLRMRFAIRNLNIQGEGDSVVRVELQHEQLHVISNDGSFQLTANFFDALLNLYPYRSNEHEFPPFWYSQF